MKNVDKSSGAQARFFDVGIGNSCVDGDLNFGLEITLQKFAF